MFVVFVRRLITLWLLHIGGIVTQITRQNGHLDAQFNDVKSNTKLLATVLTTIKVDSVAACIAHCLQNNLCKSVNVNIEQNLCELLDGVFVNNTDVALKQEAKGWVHYQYSKTGPNCNTYTIKSPHGPRKQEVCCKNGKTGEYCQHSIGYHESAPAISCKTIKETNLEAVNGLYWIDLGVSVHAYCDMETDGGGWTLVTNITIVNGENPKDYYLPVSKDADITHIGNAINGRFALDKNSFTLLRQHLNFDSLRVNCYKHYTNRRLDLVLFGDHVEFLTGVVSTRNNPCQDKRFLDDDTSNMGQEDCATYRWGHNIYTHYVYISSRSHIIIHLEDRMECDDYKSEPGYNPYGAWYYYVR